MYERGEDTSEYRYSGIQVNPWFLFRLGESNIFAGPQVDLNYDKITKPAAGMVNESSSGFCSSFRGPPDWHTVDAGALLRVPPPPSDSIRLRNVIGPSGKIPNLC